ncbi:MAG: histidine phosphatase family protein [Rubrivivax sp.]
MGTLHLVRHGQASFGSADYDRLSALGAQQCRRLGEHLRARGLVPQAVYTGTLRRHAQSLAALAEGFDGALPATRVRPGLDEYDAHAVVHALYPEPPPAPDDAAAAYRHHFRLLREGLLAWMAGRSVPQGMPSHAEFVAGVGALLDHVRTQHDGDVLVVSSGGPIATAVGIVLGLTPAAVVELNLRLRNSAVSEFVFTPKRHSLQSFNGIAHLEQGGVPADWVTWS